MTSSSEDLKSAVADVEPIQPVEEATLDRVLHLLADATHSERKMWLRRLIELAIRLYLVRHSSFNTTRANQLLDLLSNKL